MTTFEAVPTLKNITVDQFHADYLDREQPVHISGGFGSKARQRWSPEYFRAVAPDLEIPVKEYGKSGIRQKRMTMGEYVDFLLARERDPQPTSDALPYCHDIPIFAMLPSLVADMDAFPSGLLSDYYRRAWWRYVQFFMGPANSVTPLHFDTLLTHNLFFQIYGSKRFTLYSPSDSPRCGRRGWRWFDLDPERPDNRAVPVSKRPRPHEVMVNAGDILYMPPGTLHHVRGLSTSISFNIDFHTRSSALRSLLGPLRGMPLESFYYNAVAALGVVGHLPEDRVFRYYKPYLSYVV